MEQAVDVVENVFFADGVGGGVAAGLPGVGGAEMLQAGVGDGVAARISRCLFREQAARGVGREYIQDAGEFRRQPKLNHRGIAENIGFHHLFAIQVWHSPLTQNSLLPYLCVALS